MWLFAEGLPFRRRETGAAQHAARTPGRAKGARGTPRDRARRNDPQAFRITPGKSAPHDDRGSGKGRRGYTLACTEAGSESRTWSQLIGSGWRHGPRPQARWTPARPDTGNPVLVSKVPLNSSCACSRSSRSMTFRSSGDTTSGLGRRASPPDVAPWLPPPLQGTSRGLVPPP